MVDEKLIRELRKKDFQSLLVNNLLISSSVVKTLTNDCCLKCGSLDQIEELTNNASARYGESFESNNASDALTSNLSYSKDLKNLILLSTSCCLIPNSCSESFDFNKQISLCLLSSDFIYSGAENSACSDENKYELIDPGFINEKKILLSNTSFIISAPYFLTFLSNSALIEGETSESNLLNESFFAFLPSSTLHFMNSCSSLDLSLLSNLSRVSLFRISSLASSDQLTQDNSFISDFILSGIANVKDAIYISPFSTISSNFFSCLTLRIIIFLNTSDHLTSGNLSSFFFKSSGIDKVTVAILVYVINYVNESKYVCIFKPYGFDEECCDLSSASFSDICLVEIPKPILNNRFSYVQSLIFFIKQSAIKSSSFACFPNKYFALGRKSLYSSNGTKIIFSNNREANSLNSISESFDFSNISSLLLINSALSASGAKTFSSGLNNKFTISPLEIRVLNSTFASIPISIHTNPFSFSLLCIDILTFADNKSASFSVNLDLDTAFRNFSSSAVFFKSPKISSLTSSDQFTHDKCSILDFIASSIVNVTLTIYNSPFLSSSSNFSNFLTHSFRIPRITSGQFTSGCLSIFSLNSFGNDNVIFAILVPPRNAVCKHNVVYVFKSFDCEILDFDSGNYRLELNYDSRILYELKRRREITVRKDNYDLDFNNSNSSLVLNTLTIDCLFNNFSSDHKGQLNFKANARYGASFICSENNLKTFGIESSNSSLGNSPILFSRIESNLKNSSSERCDLVNISSLCLENSSNKNSGAISSIVFEKRMVSDLVVPLINKENISLASTTTSIYFSPNSYFLNNALFTSLPNLNASSSVNSLCDLNFLRNSKSAIFCLNASLATADQFISEKDSILCLSSPGTDNVRVVIFNASMCNYLHYVYYVYIFKPFDCEILDFDSGNCRLELNYDR